jgi:hypothetical protein
MAVEFQKDILGNLLGQPAVSGHAQSQRINHRLVLLDDLFKIRLPVVFYSYIRRSCGAGMQKVQKNLKKAEAAGHVDVLAWLKAQGKGYQSRMNAILRREMLTALKAAAAK